MINATANYTNRERNSWENAFVWFSVYNAKYSEPIDQYINHGYSRKVRVNMHNVLYMEPIHGEGCKDLYAMYFINGYKLIVMDKRGVY